MTARVLVARFGAPHGVRGEIRIKSFTQRPEAIASYGPLFDATGTRYTIAALRLLKDDILVARVADLTDRDAAQALTNRDLFVERAALPAADDDEFYHADLVGLRAETLEGVTLGTVKQVLNYGAGDILEVDAGAGETLLLPFTRAVVPTIDIAAGRLVVVPPAETAADDPSERGRTIV